MLKNHGDIYHNKMEDRIPLIYAKIAMKKRLKAFK
ncbi:hypothetical protein SDC9_123272 [bioreactor metagenome]|uniref:Uncharacterized protein n=1 Tax=bioreactor metagenome TaxID=1076179 RepID=A0A645CHA0_9ZZZZ